MTVIEQPLLTRRTLRVGWRVHTAAHLALGGIAFALFAWLLSGALRAPRPSIYPDEYIYSQLQVSLGLHHHFAVMGRPFAALSYGPVFPALLAPLTWLGLSPLGLYRVDEIATCLLYSSAVVPSFLISRRLLPFRAALVAAALMVALPSSFLATRLMTDGLAYPVFLWTLLVMWRALESPSSRRRLAVLAVIVLSIAVRAQLLALAPAYLCAELALRDRRTARSGIALLAACAFAVPFVLPLLPRTVLGMRHGFFDGHRGLSAAPVWGLYNLVGVEIYVGVIPALAAAVMYRSWLSSSDRRRRTLAVLSLSLYVWFGALVGLFVSQLSARTIIDRYTFYLAAPLLLAFVAWIAEGMPRPRRTVLGVCAPLALAPLVLPYHQLFAGKLTEGVGVAILPLHAFYGAVGWDAFLFGLGVSLVVAFASFVFVPRQRVGYLVILVLLGLSVTGLIGRASNGHAASVARRCLSAPGWVDARVSSASIISSGSTDLGRRCALVGTAFFNRVVTHVYDLGAGQLLAGASVQARVDGRGILRSSEGQPLRAAYVVSDMPVVGTLLLRDKHGVGLYRTAGRPVRLASPARPS